MGTHHPSLTEPTANTLHRDKGYDTPPSETIKTHLVFNLVKFLRQIRYLLSGIVSILWSEAK